MEDGGKKTIGQMHIYTRSILERLLKCEIGDTVTYDELSRIIGIGVRPGEQGYGYLYTAVKVALKENKLAFDNLRKVGVKRVSPKEVGGSSYDILVRSRKSLNRRMRDRLEVTNDHYDEFDKDTQVKTTMARTIIAMDSQIFKPKNQRVLMDAASMSATAGLIGFDKTLDLFKPKSAE